MLQLFEYIQNVFSPLFSFFGDFLSNLISTIGYLFAAVTYLYEMMQYLPPVLTIGAAGVVAIAILHFMTLSA